MSCALIPFDTTVKCPETDGGIYEIQVVDGCEIVDVIYNANNENTNFVMSATGLWETYPVSDDDELAFFNQVGERNGSKYTVNQETFIKRDGVTQNIINFANAIKGCCQLVLIARFNGGASLVQGIDYNSTTGLWKLTKQTVKATPSIYSDTGDNKERIEVSFTSVAKCLANTTLLTSADITAL